MKKIITTILLLFVSLSFSQGYFIHDYRYIPEDKLQHHIKIEKHFWSKVAQLLIKEGKLNGWAMLQREGGASNEPNIYFYIGIGDKTNLEKINENFPAAREKVLKSMGEDASELTQLAINVEPTTLFNTIMERSNSPVRKNNSEMNFIKINYAKVNRNIGQFNNMQKNVWGSFIKKEMDKGNGSQVMWTTARKVSPNGNGYNWNYMTIDGYESYSDLLAPSWNPKTKFPEGLDEINSMMEGNTFWKQVTWRILMSVDSEGNFKVHN
tara:strand:- start:31 stop:828 length:798 start_codon:yes stop_codon:yes gene_type:complete